MRKPDLKMNFIELVEGSSSVHPAVHFAHLLGCSPIVLLGCDCQYDGDKYHYYDYPGEEVDEIRKPEYANFKPKNLIVQEGDSNKYLDGHIVLWEKIQKQNPDINIIDTSGGRLDMFPQMTIKEVIKIYGRP